MKPVYQAPMDGECMRAAICSLFEIPLEAGPQVQCEGHTWNPDEERFKCTILEHEYEYTYKRDGKNVVQVRYKCDDATQQDQRIRDWAARFGLTWVSQWLGYGDREVGPRPSQDHNRLVPPGLCITTGPSPRFDGSHAVVWDTRIRDFERPMGQMVHDPAPVAEGERPGVKVVEQFCWFEVEDPALLFRLAEASP